MPDPQTGLTVAPRISEVFSPTRLPNFEPRDIGELELFAKIISNSGLAPKDYVGKLENCMVAIMMGRELGLSPIQALQGIAVVNGRPSIWGDAMWALVVSHPEYGGCEERATELEATCKLTRIQRGRTSSVETSFSMKEARDAGLLDKNSPWKTYPKRMMMWRARTFAARDLFPDALKGITSIEEARDYIEGEIVTPQPAANLPAASYTSAPAEPAKGDQAKPDADPFITPDEGKEWNKAWDDSLKAAGLAVVNDRAKVKREELDRIGISKTSEMRRSQLPESLDRAKAYKRPQSEAASNSAPAASESKGEPVAAASAEEDKPEDKPEDVRETMARDWFRQLSIGSIGQQPRIARHTVDGITDWGKVLQDLEPEMQKAGLAE